MANRTYDLIVLIDADAPSDTRAKIVADTTTLINQHGDVKQTKDWGLRQTPYRIDHHEEATFHVFQFETDPEAIARLDRNLKLTEGVLRFRMFQSEAGDLPDSPPAFKREERAYERPPANVAATENIQEAPAPAAPAPAAGEAPVEAPAAADAPAAAPEEAPAPSEPVAPVEATPVEPAPVEPAPVEAAPVEPAPVEPAPPAESPAVDAPSADTPAAE